MAAPRSRSPHRRPLASKLNALAILSEDEELTPTKKAAPPAAPAAAPTVAPTASPSKPTAADVAAADAALARMEAELAAQIRAPPPPPPAGSPDSSDSSSSDEDSAPPRRAASWRKSVGRRGSTGRRASLEHATPAQRRALRRLSAILADGGAARRARERESGARRAREAAVGEARARMVAQRRARLKSVAKMIDLALVWEWLEANATDAAHDDADVSVEEAAKLDEEALTIVAEMASAAAEARGRELQLAAAPGAPRGHRASVCRALRTLRSLATLRVRVDAYDLQRGFYGVRVAIPVDGGASRTIVVQRSWRDLLKLRKGLAKRLPPVAAAALKKLPRARPLSTLKRSVRNLAGAGKGDRKWQRSKLPQVDAWLRGAVGVVAREASRAGRIDAEEFLEDFLFAYGTVAEEA